MNKKKRLFFGTALLFLIRISAFGMDMELPQNNHQLSLDVTVNRNFIGIPEGVAEQGFEVWVDFDDKKSVKSVFGAPSPPGWDIVFTHVVNTVSMGPMGKHPIPFFAIRINNAEGAGFYMVEDEYNKTGSASAALVKGTGWTGYGHRQQNDNSRLERAEYKLSWPYLSYDWYEMIKMTDFKYRAYPGRVFIILTSGGNAVKIQFSEVEGLRNGTLFSTEYRYDTILVRE